MSNISRKKTKKPETLSEQKTLPIQSQDGRMPNSNAARQSDGNVERAKRWGEDHQA